MNRILSILIVCILLYSSAHAQQRSDMEARKLSMALYAISNLYVDKTDEKKLVEDAIVGMLEKLDPHSDYSDPEETKELTEPLDSNFDGIGIQFNMLTDTLYVIQVISGGPSEKVGLMAGDRIIMVDDSLIAGVKMKTSDIMKRLKGPKGTEVRVKVKRGTSNELLEFKIIRGKIPVYSLDAAYMADATTGYIRLNRFAASSNEEFNQALDKLRKQGMKHLILDLQGNGGGYLHVACALADEFLGKDRLIVYTKGNRQPREEADATDKGGFGKGLVQKPIPMPDGSMIRLTVARYYTPSGRYIQKPYKNGQAKEYNRDLIERYNRGELMNADSIHFPDSLRFNTLLNKRTVYGGGGIMPDIFIPFDSTRYTDYHRKVAGMGIVNRVAMNYLDRNRKELSRKYPAFKTYRAKFEVTDEMLQELQKLAADEKIEFNEEQYHRSKPLISLQLKALIARDLFNMNEYFQTINDDNESLKEALRIINDEAAYRKVLGQSQ